MPSAEAAAPFTGAEIRIILTCKRLAMKLPRRTFLHLAASAAALPAVSRIASAQTCPTASVAPKLLFGIHSQIIEKTAAIARSAQSSLRERQSDRYTVQGGRVDRHRAHSHPCRGWGVLHVLGLPQAIQRAAPSCPGRRANSPARWGGQD